MLSLGAEGLQIFYIITVVCSVVSWFALVFLLCFTFRELKLQSVQNSHEIENGYFAWTCDEITHVLPLNIQSNENQHLLLQAAYIQDKLSETDIGCFV